MDLRRGGFEFDGASIMMGLSSLESSGEILIDYNTRKRRAYLLVGQF